jgi:bacteriophage antirepressor
LDELISITTNEVGEPTVLGRELHDFLKVATPYDKWFPRMAEYGFSEGKDFSTFLSESTGGRPSTDHLLTIDMAKELAMIQRTERGKQARQYFIQVEKDYNSPEKIMARALRIAEKELSTLKLDVERMKPKEIFADSVASSHSTILIGELAKILKAKGYETGQKRLFETLRQDGFLIKRKSSDYNMPTQKAMELGLFEIKETVINNPDGSIRVSKTTKVTGRGQIYFVNRYCCGYEWETA